MEGIEVLDVQITRLIIIIWEVDKDNHFLTPHAKKNQKTKNLVSENDQAARY